MGPEVFYSSCGISSSSLEQLRNILIISLPHENIGEHDRQRAERIKNIDAGSRPSSANRDDREARLKTFKERQNEDRQRKLEEMKSQALAAQKFKEQKEYERRLRLDELRVKEDERRQLVEERKKAINDAERDRLESILKRNQEREARYEAKRKNERSSLVFAFGSSTPRVLGPAETASSFWGPRRATSTQNIMYSAPPLTRRQSERELDGSKKRATSAGGLENSEATMSQHPAGCISGYVGRRRTDLMPTILPKESLSTPPRKSFLRSPGRAYSMSRLDQLAMPRKKTNELPSLAESASNSSFKPLPLPKQSSVSRSMSHLAVGKLRPVQPQKPLQKADSRSMHQLSTVVPLPPPRTTRATELRQRKLATVNSSNNVEGPSRPSSSLSQQSTSSVASSVVLRSRPTITPRRQRPISIAVTGVSTELKNGIDPKKAETKPPLPKTRLSNLGRSQEKITKRKSLTSPTETLPKTIESPTILPNSVENSTSVTQIEIIQDMKGEASVSNFNDHSSAVSEMELVHIDKEVKEDVEIQKNEAEEVQLIDLSQPLPVAIEECQIMEFNEKKTNVTPIANSDLHKEVEKLIIMESNRLEDTSNSVLGMETLIDNDQGIEIDMSASMNLKHRITTEEEAKAALAERRRFAREEAEKQAELEKLRIEEEYRLEMERQQREEELQRQLIEQQRVAEEERLNEAIKETQRREEEDKIRREEEQRVKVLKEETERKAKEETERQKAELQERLKNEEKEREARRKRVEAIMLRTRGKNNSGNASQTEEKNAENKMNGSNADVSENGHKNEKDLETVDNIIPVDTLKNANTVTTTTLSTDDTLNSNNAWQRNSQTDLLM